MNSRYKKKQKKKKEKSRMEVEKPLKQKKQT